MNEVIKIRAFLLLALLVSCSNDPDQKNEGSKLEQDSNAESVVAPDLVNINTFRKVEKHGYTIDLKPFELFDVVTFKGVAMGMFSSLVFENKDGDEIHINNTYFEENNKGVSIPLQRVNYVDIAKLLEGEDYKMIYAYWHDDAVSRDNLPTESGSGYFIIDIVPLDEDFLRDTPYDYDS